MQKKSLILIIVLLGVLVFPPASLGVMSSTNYTIFADVIDSGGLLSTTSTYSLQDSVGESPVGSVTSSAYQVIGGYQAMDWSVLTFDISASVINLGTLSVSAVSTSSVVATVTADATSGYVLSVASVGGTSLSGVGDGTVTAGSEEYGVAVSGIDAAFVNDQTVAAGLNLSSSSTAVTSADTTLIFKAAMSSASAPGSLSQSITLSVSTSI